MGEREFETERESKIETERESEIEIEIEGCQERGKTDREREEFSWRASVNSGFGQVQQLWVSSKNS